MRASAAVRLSASGARCGHTGANLSARRVPGQAETGGGAARRAGAPPYGTPRNTSTGSSLRAAASSMTPRSAPLATRTIREL